MNQAYVRAAASLWRQWRGTDGAVALLGDREVQWEAGSKASPNGT